MNEEAIKQINEEILDDINKFKEQDEESLKALDYGTKLITWLTALKGELEFLNSNIVYESEPNLTRISNIKGTIKAIEEVLK